MSAAQWNPMISHSASSGVFFLTLRLLDALPEHFNLAQGIQFYSIQQKTRLSPTQKEAFFAHFRKRLFARFNALLDQQSYGLPLLANPDVAALLQQEMYALHGVEYRVLAHAILPNRVHILLQFPDPVPDKVVLLEHNMLLFNPLRDFVRRFQAVTEKPLQAARKACLQPLHAPVFEKKATPGFPYESAGCWHPSTFDFWVPDEATFQKIADYLGRRTPKSAVG